MIGTADARRANREARIVRAKAKERVTRAFADVRPPTLAKFAAVRARLRLSSDRALARLCVLAERYGI